MTLDEVRRAIAFDQPKLKASQDGSNIIIKGQLILLEEVKATNPAGPISEYDITIFVDPRFPKYEPKVFEVGNRIPRIDDRHINPDGDCCIAVWEEWLYRSKNLSFSTFMTGPLREFFFGQYWFDQTGEWPFGERSHGGKGLLESYSDILNIPNRKRDVIYYLRLLSQDWPKGHWPCPCGSNQLLRHCHRDSLWALHERVPSNLARRMLTKLMSQLPSHQTKRTPPLDMAA